MLLIILLIIISITSCSLDTKASNSNVYLITLALNYEEMNVSTLYGTLNDQNAIISQFEYLSKAEKRNFYSHQFTQQGSNVFYRYTTTPTRGDAVEIVKELDTRSLKTEIKEVFKKLNTKKDDLVIFFYAGHGLGSTQKEKVGALILGDINTTASGSNEFKNFTYYLDDLRFDFSSITGNKLLIIDSCHSGAIVKDDQINDVFDISNSFSELFSNKKVNNDLTWELTGCTADKLSYESEETDNLKAHGRFAKVLLDYLGYKFYVDQVEGPGLPERKYLSVAEAWSYTKKALEKFGRQTPIIDKTERDLVLFMF